VSVKVNFILQAFKLLLRIIDNLYTELGRNVNGFVISVYLALLLFLASGWVMKIKLL